MKAVILAGGLGTRLSEETSLKPKPMVEIGGHPLLWHIMKTYSHYGVNDFTICLGYMGYYIKEYFINYYYHNSDLTIDLTKNDIKIHKNRANPWKVTLIDTGRNTMTGGRIGKIKDYVQNETFCLTYGDGLADINIKDLISFHKKNNKTVTVTAVRPSARFGNIDIDDNNAVKKFMEKPASEGGWINGGFFVCNPEVFNYIDDDPNLIWERKPLEDISKNNQLSAYKHHGFWQPVDTLREKKQLEDIWQSNNVPWKVW